MIHVKSAGEVRQSRGTLSRLSRGRGTERALLGDPVEIKVRGYHLTLRKHEAEQIWVCPKAAS